jgi:hypothetical protein
MPLPREAAMSIAERIIARITKRPADFVIGGHERPYLRRWFVIPRNRFFNIYLHQFLRSDDDRAHHDHPWVNVSILLRGAYVEHTIAAGGIHRRTLRTAGSWCIRGARRAHRIELQQDVFAETAEFLSCWTLFITGPRCREWGFHCPDTGWIHWKRFTAADDPGAIGPGCDA